jgi:FtsX-like permease family
MPAIWMAFRADLRSRWRAWAGVGILIGLLSGLVLAAAAGARRTDTAYPQLVAASDQASEVVFDSEPNPQVAPISGARVESLPQIAQAGHLRAFVTSESVNPFGSPAGNAFMAAGGINRAHIVAGRAFRAGQRDEVMIDFTLAEQDHLRPGSHLTLHFLRPVAGSPWLANYAARPVSFSFRVAGVVATPGQFPPQGQDYFSGPGVYLTPAFVNAHRDDLAAYDVSVVRLRPGDTGAFAAAVSRLVPGGQSPDMGGPAAQNMQVQYGFHLQAIALWLLAGLLAIVAVLVLAQLLTQRLTTDSTSWRPRWALGMTRGQLAACGVLQAVFIGAWAGVAAAIAAIVLSPLAPVGAAAEAELRPGIAIDAPIVLGGAAVLTVLAGLISALPLWRLATQATTGSAPQQHPARRASRLSDLVGRSGLPAAAVMGMRLAVDPGQGRADVPGRSTAAGAVLGVTTIVAALTFGASLTHLITTPRLYGVSWDAEVLNGNGPAAVRAAIPVLRRSPEIAGQAWLVQGIGVNLYGASTTATTTAQVLEPIAGHVTASISAGRAPASGGEIALGAATMRALHVHIGGNVRAASGYRASAPQFTMRVVGSAALAPGSVGGLGNGAVLTKAGLDRLHIVLPAPPYVIAAWFRPGFGSTATIRALNRSLNAAGGQFFVISPQRPTDLIDFGQVSYLPFAVGAILATLALALVSYLLASTVRRRRRELAIVKTLGFTRSQVRWTVASQASTLLVIAVTAGIPLGIVAGRWAWDLLAIQQGVIPEPVTPATILLVVPVMISLGITIALFPAVVAARTQPSRVLRAE